MIDKYADVFEPPGPPIAHDSDHHIALITDNQPPWSRLYRMSKEELVAVKSTITEYLAKGWIRPSASPYGAPVIVIRKKDGALRICIDYRLLNK